MRNVLLSSLVVAISSLTLGCGNQEKHTDEPTTSTSDPSGECYTDQGETTDHFVRRSRGNGPIPCPNPDSGQKPNPQPQPQPKPGEPKPNPQPEPKPEPQPQPTPGQGACEAEKVICDAEQVIFRENNALRAEKGVKALTYNERLAYVARDWSKKQADAGKISHDGFAAERVKVLKAKFPGATDPINGENVAYFSGGVDTNSAEAMGKKFFEMWKGSKGHYENMVRSSFTMLGNGVYKKDAKTVYATQIFGAGSRLAACTKVMSTSGSTLSATWCETIAE